MKIFSQATASVDDAFIQAVFKDSLKDFLQILQQSGVACYTKSQNISEVMLHGEWTQVLQAYNLLKQRARQKHVSTDDPQPIVPALPPIPVTVMFGIPQQPLNLNPAEDASALEVEAEHSYSSVKNEAALTMDSDDEMVDAVEDPADPVGNLVSALQKRPGQDGKFQCLKCDFSCLRNETLKNHFMKEHAQSAWIEMNNTLSLDVLSPSSTKITATSGSTGTNTTGHASSDIADKNDNGMLELSGDETFNFNEAIEMNEARCLTKEEENEKQKTESIIVSLKESLGPDGKFQCPECKFSTDKLELCREHYYRRHGFKAWKCFNCPKSCAFRKDLKEHYKVHDPEMKIKDLPSADYNLEEQAKKEMFKSLPKLANADGLYPCPTCKRAFRHYAVLKGHYLRKHAPKPYKCPMCHERRALRYDLKKHIRSHINAEREGKSLRLSGNLKHMPSVKVTANSESNLEKSKRATELISKLNSKPNDDGSGFKCPACSFTGDAYKKVHAHIIRKHGERKHSCNLCGKLFAFSHDVTTHVYKCHVKEEDKAQCEICGRKFANMKYYNMHRELHKNNPDRFSKNPKTKITDKTADGMYKCRYCSVVFMKRLQLRNHTAIAHRGRKSLYECPVCKKQFVNEKVWKDHSFMHLGIRPYKCDKCDKSFPSKMFLDMHLKMHSAVIHQCDICQLVFKTGSRLGEHRRTAHQRNQMYVCSYCGKVCRWANQLKAHERLHINVWPYVCKVCNKKFKFVYNCKSHIKKVHKAVTKISEPEIMNYMTVLDDKQYDAERHSAIRSEWIDAYQEEIEAVQPEEIELHGQVVQPVFKNEADKSHILVEDMSSGNTMLVYAPDFHRQMTSSATLGKIAQDVALQEIAQSVTELSNYTHPRDVAGSSACIVDLRTDVRPAVSHPQHPYAEVVDTEDQEVFMFADGSRCARVVQNVDIPSGNVQILAPPSNHTIVQDLDALIMQIVCEQPKVHSSGSNAM